MAIAERLVRATSRGGRPLTLAVLMSFLLACTAVSGPAEKVLVGGGDANVDPARDAGETDDAGSDPAEQHDAGVAMQPPEVPSSAHCSRVDEWDPLWSQFEQEVLLLTNEARVRGQNCDTHGLFAPTHALSMEPRLRCAARMHALYMAEVADDFEHVTRAGSSPDQRVSQTGYDYEATGENIAVGSLSPRQLVDGWLDSDGHCANLMAPVFDEIGIGYAFGLWDTDGLLGVIEAPYWVQTFGKQR